jgi:outer membrane biosynthesis protein TonB
MTGLVPLLLMWLWSKRSSSPVRSPIWPTAASPPPAPPVPAFRPQPPPPAPTAESGTPLTDLHQTPPVPPPAEIDRPTPQPKPKAKPKRAPAAAARRAVRLVPGAPQKTVTVRDLQTVLNARGAKLTRDGLYGPKTASAWSSLAKRKGLPPTISRVSPKIARVVMHTYDALSVPAIP